MEATQQDGAARPGAHVAPDAVHPPKTKDAGAAHGTSAGQIVTAKRANLHPSTVTLLVFLHEAIPGGIQREVLSIIEDSILVE